MVKVEVGFECPTWNSDLEWSLSNSFKAIFFLSLLIYFIAMLAWKGVELDNVAYIYTNKLDTFAGKHRTIYKTKD